MRCLKRMHGRIAMSASSWTCSPSSASGSTSALRGDRRQRGSGLRLAALGPGGQPGRRGPLCRSPAAAARLPDRPRTARSRRRSAPVCSSPAPSCAAICSMLATAAAPRARQLLLDRLDRSRRIVRGHDSAAARPSRSAPSRSPTRCAERYLAYALSTITARSLPDVRDGLKPVQRRVLYAMLKLRLDPASRLQEVRPRGRRRDRQVPSPRRGRDLRRPGAPGAGVRAALSAGRRPGQLRQCRRRQRGGHALHRGAPDRGRAARCSTASTRTPSTSARPTTAATRSRWCCRRPCPTCWPTAPAASRSAWRPACRRTTSAELCRGAVPAARPAGRAPRGAARARQGAGSADRRRAGRALGARRRGLSPRPRQPAPARPLAARGSRATASIRSWSARFPIRCPRRA